MWKLNEFLYLAFKKYFLVFSQNRCSMMRYGYQIFGEIG